MRDPFIVLLAAALTSTAFAAGGTKTITKADYKEKWPFTVATVELRCEPQSSVTQYLTVKAGSNVYALNGTAKATKKYKSLEDIWRKNPDPAMAKAGYRMSVGDIIKEGLRLCDSAP